MIMFYVYGLVGPETIVGFQTWKTMGITCSPNLGSLFISVHLYSFSFSTILGILIVMRMYVIALIIL